MLTFCIVYSGKRHKSVWSGSERDSKQKERDRHPCCHFEDCVLLESSLYVSSYLSLPPLPSSLTFMSLLILPLALMFHLFFLFFSFLFFSFLFFSFLFSLLLGLTVEGVFRISGSASLIEYYKDRFDQGLFILSSSTSLLFPSTPSPTPFFPSPSPSSSPYYLKQGTMWI